MADPISRAAELNEDIKKGDAKRRADAENGFAAKALALLENLTARLDVLEAKKPDEGDEAAEDGDDLIKNARNDSNDKADAAALSAAQSRADGVALAFGARAPAPMMSEKPDAYRRRVLRPFQHHSKEFRQVDLSTLSGALLDGIEQRIQADAVAASANPMVAEGTLLERVTTDPSGRQIRSFHGSPRAWMSQFMTNPGRLTRINLHPDRD